MAVADGWMIDGISDSMRDKEGERKTGRLPTIVLYIGRSAQDAMLQVGLEQENSLQVSPMLFAMGRTRVMLK